MFCRGAARFDLISRLLALVNTPIAFIAMLHLVGLGLADETDITVRGLEIVKRAERVYLEAYTSILLVDKAKLVHGHSSSAQKFISSHCMQRANCSGLPSRKRSMAAQSSRRIANL